MRYRGRRPDPVHRPCARSREQWHRAPGEVTAQPSRISTDGQGTSQSLFELAERGHAPAQDRDHNLTGPPLTVVVNGRERGRPGTLERLTDLSKRQSRRPAELVIGNEDYVVDVLV